MPAPADRVQILKQESTALGGDDADAVEWGSTPLDPGEDAPEVRGVFFQPANPTARDELVYATRDGAGNLIFRDVVTGAEVTLSDLAAGGGGALSLNNHVLVSDFTVTAGKGVVVPRYVEIAAGVTLELGASGDLEIS